MVLLYQVAQFSLLVLFAVAISDFRRKKNMEAFGRRGFLVALKLMYLVPLAIFAWRLAALTEVAFYDAIAVALTACGTFLAVRGKIDLGKEHAWTGYKRSGTNVITHGIYSWVRNPIYSGIFAFIIGAAFTVLPRINLPTFIACAVTVIYIVSFLAVSARRETHHLMIAFGEEYEDYKRQVHPFLPIKRYRDAA